MSGTDEPGLARRSRLPVPKLTALIAAGILVLCLSSPGSAQGFDYLYNEAKLAEEAGDIEKALDLMQRCKAIVPADEGCRQKIASFYEHLRRYKEAEDELQSVLSYNPKSITTKKQMARLYTTQGKHSQALNIYQELVAQDSKDLNSLYLMGNAYEGQGDLESARTCYLTVQNAVGEESQNGQVIQARLDKLETATKERQDNTYFPIDPEFGETGFGWWDMSKLPIHVYIDDPTGYPGYRDSMRTQVIHALDEWSSASGGKLRFIIDSGDPVNEEKWKKIEKKENVLMGKLAEGDFDLPDDPVKSQLHVHWATNETYFHALGVAWTSALKYHNSLTVKHPVIKKAHLWLWTNISSDGTVIPEVISNANHHLIEAQDRMFNYVTVHELGHTLGLPHSHSRNDIMSPGVFGLNSRDITEEKHLTIGDINSLAQHYHNFEGRGFPPAMAAELEADSDDTEGGEARAIAKRGGASRGTPATTVAGTHRIIMEGGSATSTPQSAPAQTPKRPASAGSGDLMSASLQDFNSQRYEPCIEKLKSVIQTYPKHAQAHYLMGVSYVMLKNYPEASRHYQEVLKLESQSNLGRLAAEGLKQLGK